MKSRYAIGCALGAVLLIVGIVYLAWRAKTPPKVAENFRQLPPQEQQRRRVEARQLEDQVQEVARKVKSGDKTPFRLVATEDQLNTLVQDRINTDKFAIRDLRVGLDNNQFTLQGTLPYKGVQATATLSGTVSAQDGKLDYKVDSFLIGGLFQAPKKWRRTVEEKITPQLNKLLVEENLYISRAAVEDKQLIIEGAPR